MYLHVLFYMFAYFPIVILNRILLTTADMVSNSIELLQIPTYNEVHEKLLWVLGKKVFRSTYSNIIY